LPIDVGEMTTADRDAERLEIARRDEIDVHDDALGRAGRVGLLGRRHFVSRSGEWDDSGKRDRLHARQRAESLGQIGKIGARARGVVAVRLGVRRQHEYIFALDAEISGERALQSADEQSGRDQQDEANRDLGDHEHVPQTCARDAPAEQRALRAESGIHVEPGRLQGGRKSETNPGQKRHSRAISEDDQVRHETQVDGRPRNPRNPQSWQCHHHAQPCDTGDGAEKETFSQKLSNQSPAARAELSTAKLRPISSKR